MKANADSIIAARVAERAAAETALEAAQAAAEAHARAGLALMHKRTAAGVAAVNAVAHFIDPNNATHSTRVDLQACMIMLEGLLNTIAANGGTRVGLSDAAVVDATVQVLRSRCAMMAASGISSTAVGTAASGSGSTIDTTAVVDALLAFYAAGRETTSV